MPRMILAPPHAPLPEVPLVAVLDPGRDAVRIGEGDAQPVPALFSLLPVSSIRQETDVDAAAANGTPNLSENIRMHPMTVSSSSLPEVPLAAGADRDRVNTFNVNPSEIPDRNGEGDSQPAPPLATSPPGSHAVRSGWSADISMRGAVLAPGSHPGGPEDIGVIVRWVLPRGTFTMRGELMHAFVSYRVETEGSSGNRLAEALAAKIRSLSVENKDCKIPRHGWGSWPKSAKQPLPFRPDEAKSWLTGFVHGLAASMLFVLERSGTF
ncbi:hypothetical protein T484DRAFT_1762669 [Baffinella frigidus]|nr:hypothetical protein T484DRAFT_1762669 [Cryptophyta sp. CCMP2293]